MPSLLGALTKALTLMQRLPSAEPQPLLQLPPTHSWEQPRARTTWRRALEPQVWPTQGRNVCSKPPRSGYIQHIPSPQGRERNTLSLDVPEVSRNTAF